MDRRCFIKTAMAVSSLPLLTAPGLSSANIRSNRFTAGILSIPESLKEEFVSFDTYAELEAYRNKLLATCTRIDREWLINLAPSGVMPWHLCHGAPAQGFHAWTLYVEAEDGNDLLLYSDNKFPFENKQGIRNWLARYLPESWDDVAMVQKLYRQHVFGFRAMYSTRHQPHPWLDNLLRPTRGKIFYSYQALKIVRHACAMSNEPDWVPLIFGGELNYLNRFDELIFEEGRSLLDVIEDRSAYIGVFDDRFLNTEDNDVYMASILWQWCSTE